ncbi:hypothetical protein [Roseateles chitinivorans]|uniref:hypothetical protein n=1 Tax=Roseateles chitinivorans TaxID=2917965 RepID=UPI003D67B6F7
MRTWRRVILKAAHPAAACAAWTSAARAAWTMASAVALLVLGAMSARAEIPDRALDAQLAQLDRFGYNEPDKAAQQLRALLADPAHAAHRLHIDYTLGRNAVQAGRPDDVRRTAAELEAQPGADRSRACCWPSSRTGRARPAARARWRSWRSTNSRRRAPPARRRPSRPAAMRA